MAVASTELDGIDLPGDQRQVSRYLAILFCALGLVILAGAGAVNQLGQAIGATTSLTDLANLQARDRTAIVRPFDLRYWADLKLQRMTIVKPEVIFIGSSRGGSIRREMLAPYAFYNLSHTAWTLDQITDIFDRATREFTPRTVIVNLDYFIFTDAWVRNYANYTMRFADPFYRFRSGVNMMQTAARRGVFLRDCIIPIFQTGHRCEASEGKFVGTAAITEHSGFRADGSHRYAPYILMESDKNTTADFLVRSFHGAPAINLNEVRALEHLAALARKRGITLVAVQFPFVKAAVDYLDNNESYHAYAGAWRDFEGSPFKDQLRRMGIAFFDLSRAPLNQDKENFIDAYHLSEIGMLRIARADGGSEIPGDFSQNRP